MAYVNENQRRVILVPNHQFVDLRALNHHHFALINPSFAPVFPSLVPANLPVPLPVGLSFNPAFLARMELKRSLSLQQFMNAEGLVPSPEEEVKRRKVIEKLKVIVMDWIKRVAYNHRLPKWQIRTASATILTYGSYGLGVHNVESDIDALCVGPCFASMAEDFFIVLHNMLSSRPEVSEMHCVKDAKVPLMRFKFEGISIDLPYAQLKVPSFPEDVDILDPFFLTDIDETSWRSLSGVRANKSILQLVPDVEIFQKVLRCTKLWAKRRGLYGNLLGFFGGVHLAVLAAYICQTHPNASLGALVSIFFKTFAYWPWPVPVILQDGAMPLIVPSDTRSFMPIQLPCSPQEYCLSHISNSTFNKIKSEFRRGHLYLSENLLGPHFDWRNLFEPFPYTRKYKQFVKVRLSAPDQEELGEWVGWVKSRFRCLLVMLEEVQGFCDPNPSEYVDMDIADPNVVFYWGLNPCRSDFLHLDSTAEDFMKNISIGYRGPPGQMALSIVQTSQLPKNVQLDTCMRASWRISDCNQQMMYSRQMHPYFVGYQATNGNPQYLCAGD